MDMFSMHGCPIPVHSCTAHSAPGSGHHTSLLSKGRVAEDLREGVFSTVGSGKEKPGSTSRDLELWIETDLIIEKVSHV